MIITLSSELQYLTFFITLYIETVCIGNLDIWPIIIVYAETFLIGNLVINPFIITLYTEIDCKSNLRYLTYYFNFVSSTIGNLDI